MSRIMDNEDELEIKDEELWLEESELCELANNNLENELRKQSRIEKTCSFDDFVSHEEAEAALPFSISCWECTSTLSSLDDIEHHFSCILCIDCDFSCTSIVEMSEHAISTHGGSEVFCNGQNFCSECSLQTSSTYLMAVHLLQNHEDRCATDLSKMVCEMCSSIDSQIVLCRSTADLTHHNNNFHADYEAEETSEKSWNCDLCNKFCSSEEALRFHLSLKHQVNRNAVASETTAAEKRSLFGECPAPNCGMTFNGLTQLHSHLNKVHLNEDLHLDGFIHGCEQCSFRFLTEKALQQHVSKTHRDADEGQMPCPALNCHHRVATTAQLQRHLNQAHPELATPEGLECNHCSRRFGHQLALSAHDCSKSGPALRRKTNYVPCSLCTKLFRSKMALSVHVKHRHQGVPRPVAQKFICPIEECSNIFTTPKFLDRHLAEAHKQEAKQFLISCPHAEDGCNESFTSERSLSLHLAKSHKPGDLQLINKNYKKLPVCPVPGCLDKFPHQLAVGRHLHAQHPDYEPPGYVRCPECTIMFPSKRSLNLHIGKSHDKEHHHKPVEKIQRQTKLATEQVDCPCLDCDVKMCSSTLIHHINQYHTPAQIPDCRQCPQCRMLLIGEKSLWMHTIKMHRTKDRDDKLLQNPYVCPVSGCGQQLKRKRELELHLRGQHPDFTVDGDLSCTHCGLRFATDRALRMHTIKMHNDKLPLACTQPGCDRRFYGGSWLNRHLEIVHLLVENRMCVPCNKKLPTVERFHEHQSLCRRGRIKCETWHLCSKCKLKFRTAHGRDEHSVKCTQEIVHRCDDCDMTFASATNLLLHNRTLHAKRCKLSDKK